MMDFLILQSSMKMLMEKQPTNKIILNKHIQKIQKITNKCYIRNCCKKPTYVIYNLHYCWFHNIEISLKG